MEVNKSTTEKVKEFILANPNKYTMTRVARELSTTVSVVQYALKKYDLRDMLVVSLRVQKILATKAGRKMPKTSSTAFSWVQKAIRMKPADCTVPYRCCYLCLERKCIKEKTL